MESWERKRGEGQRGARAGQRGRHPLVSSFLIKSVLWLQSSEVNERRRKERREKGRPSTFSSRLAAESGHQEHQVGREPRKRGNCDSFTLANCPYFDDQGEIPLNVRQSSSIFVDSLIWNSVGK